MFILILLNVQTKHCVHFNIILSKIWVNMRKKQIVNAKPKNEHMILNNFFRPLQYWQIKYVVTFSEPFFGLQECPQ